MSAVIAQRELGCGGQIAHIRIYAPEPDQKDWRCDYEISWPSQRIRAHAMGVDSFQALQLVMRSIASDVALSDAFKAGKLAVFGEPVTSAAELDQLFILPGHH
jgi:hypothetical protein